MKLTSTILLGLGMTAAMASGDANLRANTSSRQLNSNQASGGTWMFYLMLNALLAPIDAAGGGNCCSSAPPARCSAPHLGPPASSSCGSGSGSSSNQTGGKSGNSQSGNGEGTSQGYNEYSYSDGEDASDYSYSDGEEVAGDSDEDNSTQESYLANEYTNGGSGNAAQVDGSKGLNVWPFLAAALVVGIVAAALMAKKKRQRTEPNSHTLSGSVQKRMALFGGGMFRKEKPAAASSLCENDYENEPSL